MNTVASLTWHRRVLWNQDRHLLNLSYYQAAVTPTCACLHAKSLQSCPTLCNPMDCNPPGSSVHGILQIRILEWVAMVSAVDPTNSWIESRSTALQADSLPSEPPGKPNSYLFAIKCSNVFPLHSIEDFKERRAGVNIYLWNTWLEHHLSLGLILYLINVCFPIRL